MRLSRPLVVVIGLAVAGLVLLSWTQTWFTLHLRATSATASTVTVDGSTAASSYSALAIASLALFLALTIAGRVLRVVLAAIEILLGVAVIGTGLSALGDPVLRSVRSVETVTGVSDVGSIRRVVVATVTTPWPYVGIVAGVLAALLGVLVIVVQRSWPGPGRRYVAAGDDVRRAVPVDVPRDAIFDWDDLSAGVDPTDGAERTGVEQTAARAAGARAISLGAHPEPDDKEHREQR